jgi:NADP-dependent 3-hydroxy acid dehydrogenase YdfG
MFINNAQESWFQTELLFEMAQRWTASRKHIMVISTMMTQQLTCTVPGLEQYRLQKIALEQAVQQLRHQRLEIKFTIVRPGDIATSADKTVPPSADVDRWAGALISMLELADPDLSLADISLGPRPV